MNMRSLTVILGAFTAFALGACTVTSGTSSTGSGGSGTTTTGGVGGGDATTATGTTATGTASTGTSMCDAKYTCSEAIDPAVGDPTKLCEGPSAMLYDTYFACTCETGGACFAACGENACKDGTASADCTACLQKNDMGCAKEQAACAGDAPN